MKFILHEKATKLAESDMFEVDVVSRPQAQFVVNALAANVQGHFITLSRDNKLLSLVIPVRRPVPTVVDMLSGTKVVVTEHFKNYLLQNWRDVCGLDWASKVNRHKMTVGWTVGVPIEPEIKPLNGEENDHN